MICSRPLSPGDVLNGPCAECGHPSLAHRRAHFDAELSYRRRKGIPTVTALDDARAYQREWAAKTDRPAVRVPDQLVDAAYDALLGVCRSGCATQDHASYAECLKAAAIQIGNLK